MTSRDSSFARSRRQILTGIVAGLGAAAAATSFADMARAAGQMAKTAVAYQDGPKGDRRCDNCALFQAPNACRSVDGAIAAQGWCKIWVAKR